MVWIMCKFEIIIVYSVKKTKLIVSLIVLFLIDCLITTLSLPM